MGTEEQNMRKTPFCVQVARSHCQKIVRPRRKDPLLPQALGPRLAELGSEAGCAVLMGYPHREESIRLCSQEEWQVAVSPACHTCTGLQRATRPEEISAEQRSREELKEASSTE